MVEYDIGVIIDEEIEDGKSYLIASIVDEFGRSYFKCDLEWSDTPKMVSKKFKEFAQIAFKDKTSEKQVRRMTRDVFLLAAKKVPGLNDDGLGLD